MPWARALNELKANRADGIIGVWPNSYVDRGFRASSPIFISKLGFYVPTAQRVPLLDLTQLRGRIAGGVRNYGYPTALYKTGVHIDVANDDQSNLKKTRGWANFFCDFRKSRWRIFAVAAGFSRYRPQGELARACLCRGGAEHCVCAKSQRGTGRI
ncbi:hypothetical protein [Deefgea sp. CFH1-16]|uniref:hypothetical protein n=1 Tax=Deefgea sp. CFH1-16 TaxID=2675457 RepID=UPI001FFCAA6C|nr:hypothetical protein [Deefgea sp. CFH1-16]